MNKLARQSRLTRETLDALRANREIPEVKLFLAQLEQAGYRVPSRFWHYFRYRYLFNDPLHSPAELDERFDRVLADPTAGIYPRGGQRFTVVSKLENRLAIVDREGLRITVYRFEDKELAEFGEPQWDMTELMAD